MVRRAARQRRSDVERGSITLESVVIWPTVLFAIFAIIQGGLWFHARNVALGAAQEGARAASVEARGDGEGRAHEFISDAGGTSVITVDGISQTTTGDIVTITITGRAPSLFPGLPGPAVTQHHSAPLRGWSAP